MVPIKIQDCYILVKNEYANMIHDMITVLALEKKENMICITKEQFEKIIRDAIDFGRSQARLDQIENPKSKTEYINSIITNNH